MAKNAGISIATLSRVETNKQNVDVSLLLTLSCRLTDTSSAAERSLAY